MAEIDKKTKAPAKPRKSPAKKAAILTMTNSGSPSVPIANPTSYEEVARLAHRYWADRGCQHGHDVEDWFRAEQELRAKAS